MNRAVLITGGSARIGKALSLGLAKYGWTIVIHFRQSGNQAKQLAQSINKTGGHAVTVGGNLNIPAELDSLVDRAAETAGMPITALINNASTFEQDSAHDFSHALFDHHMDVNVRAPLRLAQAFAAQIPSGETGAIINMIDQRVLKPNPLYFTYSLSKAALYWCTKTLAQSLAPTVRVNGIGPGPTLKNKDQSETEFASESASTLLGQSSSPSAIVDAARYLLSAESVTGQMLAVDSGQHLTWKTQDLLAGTPQYGAPDDT